MTTYDKFINAISNKNSSLVLGIIYELANTDYPRITYVRDKAKDYIKGECFILTDWSIDGDHKQSEITIRSVKQFEQWFLDSEFVRHCSLVDMKGYRLNDIEVYKGDLVEFECCGELTTGLIISVETNYCMIDANGKQIPAHKNHIKRVVKEVFNTKTA